MTKTVIKYKRQGNRGIDRHTHVNPVYLGIIGHIVVFIEKLFSNEHRSLDRQKVLQVKSTTCKVFVNVVHGGNYLQNI